MWRASVLVCATGCSLVLGIDDLDGPECLRDDDFEALDTNVWRELNPVSRADVTIVNGAVVVTPPPLEMSQNGLTTRLPIDFTGATIDVEITTESLVNGTETQIVLQDESLPDTGYAWIAREGKLVSNRFVGGVDSVDETLMFTPNQRFWRIAHDGISRVEFSVGPDRDSMQVIRSLATQPPATAMTLRLQAGVFVASNPDPVRPRFESIRTTATCR